MGITARSSVSVTVAVLLSVALLPMLAMAADEDPLQDFCVADLTSRFIFNGYACKPPEQVTAKDFTFTALKNAGDTNTPNKVGIIPAGVFQFPGLNTLGVSCGRVDYARGGIVVPHTHNRATELLLMLKGELYVGFSALVNNVNTLYAKTVKEGELWVFPKGLVHFQLNVGKGPATAFIVLTSQNGGIQQIAPSLFIPDIKDEVLEKTFRIDKKTVNQIQKQFRE